MKQIIIPQNKGVDPILQNETHEITVAKIETSSSLWSAYYYPFMPMMDLSPAYELVKEILKNRFSNKKRIPTH